jgi:hypothetical protein
MFTYLVCNRADKQKKRRKRQRPGVLAHQRMEQGHSDLWLIQAMQQNIVIETRRWLPHRSPVNVAEESTQVPRARLT